MGKKKNKLLLGLCLFIVPFMVLCKSMSAMAEEDEEEYIEIWTASDLNLIRYDLDSNYILMTDIDLSAETSEGGILDYFGYGWDPIGKYSENESEIEAFSGVFDGNNHTISGMNIRNSADYTGLFRYNKGTIKNLTISNATVTTESYNYAFVVGRNYGVLTGIKITDSVIDIGRQEFQGRTNLYAGSFASVNNGKIIRCGNEADITGLLYFDPNSLSRSTYYIGTIAGYSSGEIYECYNNNESTLRRTTTTSANGYMYVDSYVEVYLPVAGRTSSDKGKVRDYYSTDYKEYSISGHYLGGIVSRAYYVKSDKILIGSTEINLEQGKTQDNYTGFDFENTWMVNPYLDYPYPQLKNNIQTSNKVVEMLDWIKKPDKITYYNDEDIDASGGKIKAYYADGTTEIICVNKDMVSSISDDIIGQQTLTVTYGECTITYKVNVLQRTNVTEVQIASGPDVSEYVKGTKLDYSGAVARIFFEDETYRDVELSPENTVGGDVNVLGEQTVTYSYDGFEASFVIRVIPVQIIGVEVSRLPKKIEYIEGQTPDLSGLLVTVLKNNGTKTPTNDYTLGAISNTPGDCEVNVSYGTFTTSFTLSFSQKELERIEITNRPDRLNYIDGEPFDTEGMEVTAYYNNGTSELISNYIIGSYSGVGTVSVPIIYMDKKTYVSIRVTEKHATGIKVANRPNKTVYSLGSAFDTDGMVVNLVYDSGVEEEITDYTVSNLPGELGVCSLTITYNEFETSLEIEMVEPQVESIIVTTPPTKTEYIKGEQFKSTGMVVTSYWDNSTTKVVYDYIISGFDEITEEGPLIVSYNGKSTTLTIVVHEPCDEWDVVKEPTCQVRGTRQLKCKNCNVVLETESINRINHIWSDEPCESKEPTCARNGYKKYKCTMCNETNTVDIQAFGHNLTKIRTIEPTCEKTGYTEYKCEVCEETVRQDPVNALGHNEVYDDPIPATCTEDGITVGYHCSRCNKVLRGREKIKAKGHDLGSICNSKEPTCTESGYNEYLCNRCHNYIRDTIPALGHDEIDVAQIDATCTEPGCEAGKKCSRCNAVISGCETIVANGHDVEVISEVKATCTKGGSTSGKKCSVCGVVLEEPTIIPALGHEPKNAVKENEKNPTCTEKGSYDSVVYCNRCNDVISKETIETDEALGHDWDKGKVTKNASCSEEGEMTFKCSRCNGTYTDTIERKAHTPEPILSVEASCTVDGLSEGSKCSECGAILTPQTVTTKALGHNWEDTIVKPATCQKTGKKVIKCTRCGEEKEETISKNAHSIVVDPAVEATATSTGLTLGTHCSVCGEIIVPQTVIPIQTNGDSSVDKPKENNNPSDSNVNPGNEGNANTIPKNITDQDSQNSSGSSEAASNATPEPAAQPQPQVPAYSSEWVDGKWYDAQGNQTYSGTLEWKVNSSGWWIEDTDGWYPVSCWQKIDGFWYYFDSSGYMVTSAWQDGCWLGSNGAWTYEPTGLWKGDSSGWWFEDTSGWYPNSQWLKINGSWYYFDSSGYMVTSKYIDGYWIGADGVCQ